MNCGRAMKRHAGVHGAPIAALFVAVIVLAAAAAPAAGAQDAPRRLRGAWQAVDDPKVVLRFDAGQRREFYDQELLSDEPYTLRDTCPHRDLPAGGGRFIVTPDEFCWLILTLNEDTLELSHVTGRGNTLVYRRMR